MYTVHVLTSAHATPGFCHLGGTSLECSSLVELFSSIGKHLPNFLEGGTVAFTIFGENPISVISRHVVPPAFQPMHNASTMEAR